MKRHTHPPACLALALSLLLSACGKETAPAVTAAQPAPAKAEAKTEAAPPAKAVEEKDAQPAPAAAPAPQPAADGVDPLFATPAVELNGFGSDEPVIRADEPRRGVIHISAEEMPRMTAAHWEQFDCTSLNLKRWGRYEVRLTYTMRHASLGTQFRVAGQQLKKSLTATSQPRQVVYGQVYFDKPGAHSFVLYVASTGAESGFVIHDISFVPAAEGATPGQQADGTIILEAKSATTWSENMRYEPKPEKDCLGFWTSADDLAEWKFDCAKPGRYKVSVFQGCGGGNEGSEVGVRLGDQELKFTVKDTGGFQKWEEIQVGEVEIKTKGTNYLVIDPLTKVKNAVLDVSKVVLTPAG